MTEWWIADLPTWLVAVGTVGAFGTGGVVLLRELARDRERDAAAARRQASMIAVWPVRVENSAESPPTMTAHVVLNNASFEPVYDVTIEYQLKARPEVQSDRVDLLPPGRYERDMPREMQEVWVRSRGGWVKRGSQGAPPIEKPQNESWDFTLAVSFMDARGRRWLRGGDGSISLGVG